MAGLIARSPCTAASLSGILEGVGLVAGLIASRVVRFVVAVAAILAALSVGGGFFAGVVLVPSLIAFTHRSSAAGAFLYAFLG